MRTLKVLLATVTYLFIAHFALAQSLVKSFGNQTTIENITAADSIVYFTASFDGMGRELWKSNGTEAGTVIVHDINPGPANSNPTYLYFHNGILYFSATAGGGKYALWKTDGTAAGTVIVSSACNGPSFFYPCGNYLYFIANDGTHGPELWKTDGTTAGTAMVKDIMAGANGSMFNPSKSCLNGVLAFNAADTMFPTTALWNAELWKTDGTILGTQLVADLNNNAGSDPSWLTTFNNNVYFAADAKLWKSDLNGNTVLVKDVSGPWNPYLITQVGNNLFFATNTQIWKTDGTDAGTVMVKGAMGGQPLALTSYNGNLIFTVGQNMNIDNLEVWKSDGTTNGTVLVKSVVSDGNLTVFDGGVYFTGPRGFLYYTNGTTAGTFTVKDLDPCYLLQLTAVGDGSKLFFATYQNTDCPSELWVVHKGSVVNSVEDVASLEVQLWPNPTTGRFRVQLPYGQIGEVTVLDLSGRTILSTQNLAETSDIELPHPGMFIVQIRINESVIYKKVVVN